MRLPDDLAQRIDEWFEAVYRAAFDEEVEWLVSLGQSDPGYDPEETTIEELRQNASEYIEREAEHMIEPLLAKCGSVERAIILTLLKRRGFVRVRIPASPEYAWFIREDPRGDGQEVGRDHQSRPNKRKRDKRSSVKEASKQSVSQR